MGHSQSRKARQDTTLGITLNRSWSTTTTAKTATTITTSLCIPINHNPNIIFIHTVASAAMVFSIAARTTASGALRASIIQRQTVAALPAAMTLARRGYAEAVSDKLKLSFILPHAAIYDSQEVTQVNISGSTGEMGILASHVPSVEELKPGVLEVVENSGTKKWFGESRAERKPSGHDSQAWRRYGVQKDVCVHIP